MAGSGTRFSILLALLVLSTPLLAGCLAPETAVPTGGPVSGDAPEAASTRGATIHVAAPAGALGTPGTPASGAMMAGGSAASPAAAALLGAVGAARYTGGEAFEPTLGVDAQGRIFFGSFEPGLPYFGLLKRSDDQGLTWGDVTPNVADLVSLPPNSNDPYVHLDPDTGRVFLSDLQGLQCSTLSWSDDAGESWTTNPVGCGLPPTAPIHDHQTVFTAKPRVLQTVGYPNLVYYCVNRQVDTACATSVNGGLIFGPLRPLTHNGITNFQEMGVICIGGHTAHGTSGPDGTVYLPTGGCETYPVVIITKDDGLTWTPITITRDVQVYGHEVAFAVDEAGHAYAFWIGEADHLPYLAASSNGGYTWSKPVMVAPPGVKTADFPTLAAGADGRVAFAYYGTSAAKPYNQMTTADTWNAYIGLTLDALNATPTIATVTANPASDPVARGVCGGTRCGNTADPDGVGDFIDIVIDGDGRPWAAFVDMCVAACVTQPVQNDGTAAFAGTLAAGPKLRGSGSLPVLRS